MGDQYNNMYFGDAMYHMIRKLSNVTGIVSVIGGLPQNILALIEKPLKCNNHPYLLIVIFLLVVEWNRLIFQ